MKIFSWVQNKLTSKKSNSNPSNHHIQEPCKEEFSDWPHGLLAIGTFGNKIIKQEEETKANLQENLFSGHDHLHGLTPEEVGTLSKELNLVFHEHVGVPASTNLEVEDSYCDDSNNKNDDDVQCRTSLVHSRGKDIRSDNNSKGAIGKKSLSFLLKKMFVCRSGFSPAAPSLREPILESRMEKILRTILHKKIYPQSSSPKLSTKKSLESNHIPKTDNGADKKDDGSKWVKTDSEYIVLEI